MNCPKKSLINNERVGKNRQFVLRLGVRDNKVLTLKIGRPETGFFTLMLRCCANGMALGISLWFFQMSIGYADLDYPDHPILQYGVYWRKALSLYLPQRYALWGE